jgi:SAM-dependent methyltransferase
MDPYGKRELLAFFDRQLRDHGDAPQALRWTAAGQRGRYEAFLGLIGPLEGRSLLDFGCGKGDLLSFLEERGVRCSYTGVDVNEGLVALARRKHPGAQFLCRDLEEDPLPRRFDVVVACGVFNLRIGGIAEAVREGLRVLWAMTSGALHANFLSSRAGGGDVELHYLDPGELERFAREEISPGAEVREDLYPGDLFLTARRG